MYININFWSLLFPLPPIFTFYFFQGLSASSRERCIIRFRFFQTLSRQPRYKFRLLDAVLSTAHAPNELSHVVVAAGDVHGSLQIGEQGRPRHRHRSAGRACRGCGHWEEIQGTRTDHMARIFGGCFISPRGAPVVLQESRIHAGLGWLYHEFVSIAFIVRNIFVFSKLDFIARYRKRDWSIRK